MSEKPNQEPNPHESSALPPDVIEKKYEVSGEEVRYRPRTIIEDENGRVFIGDRRLRFGADQMLLARLLKGIVSVSDIVYIKDRDDWGGYYSYKLPLNSELEAVDLDGLRVKVRSEEIILSAIFSDFDHEIGSVHHQNLRVEGDEFAFFDFENFTSFWINRNMSIGEQFRKYYSDFDEENRGRILRKLNELEVRFQGNFLEHILKSIENYNDDVPVVIKEAPGDNKIESFRQEVLRRIIELKTALQSNPSNNQ